MIRSCEGNTALWWKTPHDLEEVPLGRPLRGSSIYTWTWKMQRSQLGEEWEMLEEKCFRQHKQYQSPRQDRAGYIPGTVRKVTWGVPMCLKILRTWLVSSRMWVQSLASCSGLRILCCCKPQCRSQRQLRSGVAVVVASAAAPVQPLTWELPYVTGVALKKERKKFKKKERWWGWSLQSKLRSDLGTNLFCKMFTVK